MAIHRNDITKKWREDSWFMDLMPYPKLAFLYLLGSVDNAGFLEINHRVAAFTIRITEPEFLEAMEVIKSRYVVSLDGRKIWLKNFIKHQQKLPLNPTNNAHLQIINMLEANASEFPPDTFSKYWEGGRKGVLRGLQGGIEGATSPLQGAGEGDEPAETGMEGANEGENGQMPLGHKMQQIFQETNPTYPAAPNRDMPAIIGFALFIHQQLGGKKTSIELFDNQEREAVETRWRSWADWYKANGGNKSLETLHKFKLQDIYSEITNGKIKPINTSGGRKKGTSEARIDALKNW